MWWWAALAYAQVEVCSEPYPVAEWRAAMDDVDALLADLNGAGAQQLLLETLHDLRCIDERIAPADLARYARQRSIVAFFDQDIDTAVAWIRVERGTGVRLPDPRRLPAPYRELREVPDTPIAGPTDRGLRVPPGGGVLLDGVLIVEPRARVEVPHIVQIVGAGGEVHETFVIDGASFPDVLLGPPGAPPPPAWSTEPPAAVVAEAASLPEATPSFLPEAVQAKCPWRGQPRSARARGGRVWVNGVAYVVSGDEVAFRRVLRACGEHRALRRFNRWRAAKASWRWFAAPRLRDAMIDALLAREPTVRPDAPG